MTITRRAWANDSPNTMTARAPYSTNSTPRCSILITAGGAAPLITGCSSDAALPRWSMVPTAGLLAFVEADPAAPRAGDSIASQRTRAAFPWPGHGRGQRDPRGILLHVTISLLSRRLLRRMTQKKDQRSQVNSPQLTGARGAIKGPS